jgi:hypothetical protein
MAIFRIQSLINCFTGCLPLLYLVLLNAFLTVVAEGVGNETCCFLLFMVCQGLVVPQGGGQIKKMREMICDHVMRPHFSFFRFGQIGQDFKIYFHNFPNFGEILKIPKFRKLKMISEFQIFRNLRLCCVLVWCGV